MKKRKVLKIALIVAVLAVIVGIAWYLMKKLDFQKLSDTFGNSFIFWLIITLLQVIQVVFIPISNQIITIPMVVMFPDKLLYVYLSSWIGITMGSIILYFIGRYGGVKIVAWVLGDKDKANNLSVKMNKTKFFYPIGMLIPVIPDDVLSTLAGMSKFNFLYVLLVTVITRGICVATSVFSIGLLPIREAASALIIIISLVLITYKFWKVRWDTLHFIINSI